MFLEYGAYFSAVSQKSFNNLLKSSSSNNFSKIWFPNKFISFSISFFFSSIFTSKSLKVITFTMQSIYLIFCVVSLFISFSWDINISSNFIHCKQGYLWLFFLSIKSQILSIIWLNLFFLNSFLEFTKS